MPTKKTSRIKSTAAEDGGKKRSVLIIDDEPSLLDIYKTVFRVAGWTVHVAKNGMEGLAVAEAKCPGIILLDLVMPRKDGFETLRGLKGNGKTKAIPVVILSNLGQDFEVRMGKSLGAVDFLVKAAIEPPRLVERIAAILDEQGGK